MANETNPRGPMLVLVAGSLLVAGLVAWALTRQVDPAPLETTTTSLTTTSLTSTSLNPTQSPAVPGATPGAPTTPTQVVTADEANTVSRISPEDLKALVDRGAVTVVDVRNAEQFNAGHIPGSILLPMSRVEGELTSIPRDKKIVTYCT